MVLAPRSAWSRLPLLAQIALFTALYIALAQVGLIYATAPGRVSAIWPLAGVVLVALLRGGVRLWPAILIGDLLTALWIGLPPLAAVGVSLGTTAEALLGAWVIRRATGGEPSSDHLRDIAVLIIAAGVGPGIGGMIASAGLLWGGEITRADLSTTWSTWWIGDMIGVLLVAPLLIRCDRYFRRNMSLSLAAEGAALYLSLAVVTVTLFRGNLDYSYLVAPFIIWAALRVGSRGAAIATMVFAIIAIESTSQGSGPFVQESLGTSLLYLQTYIYIIAIVSLVLSAALAERRRMVGSLRLTIDLSAALARWQDEATPAAVARLATRTFADVCIIEITQPDGTQRRSIAAPPTLEPLILERLRQHGAYAPFAPQAELVIDRPDQVAHAVPASSPYRSLFDALGARTAIIMPMCIGAYTAGLFVLYSRSPRPIAQRDELPLIRDVAQRTAQALERARIDAYMIHSQKMESIGLLAGGIAHDFNNLTSVILGSAELIRMRASGDGALDADVDAIYDAGRRARQLTNHLLAFSRKQVLSPQVVGVAELMENFMPLMRRLLLPTTQFSYEAQEGLGAVRIDVAQFEQVLMNLIINAQEAMPGGGALSLAIARVPPEEAAASLALVPSAPAYIRITVRDGGMGMTESVRARVFEPFFTTKGPGQGTGLGLATSYGIVRQSGGQITVSSVLGEGSTFTVYLPCAEAAADVPAWHETAFG
jgi:signal transduction histidine kinase